MKSSKVGKKIKYYRQENKLTQQQLADKIGVTWEMISKYERGINEPYNRIEAIAKALNTSIAELLQDDNIGNLNNQIPLFTKIPKDLKFNQNNTNFFYSCPLWILKKDRDVFAIDMNLVEKEKDGIYYISPNTNSEKGNFVLLYKGGKLEIKEFENQQKILGTILGKEVRVL